MMKVVVFVVVVLAYLGAGLGLDLEPVLDDNAAFKILDLRVSNTLKCKIVDGDEDDVKISWKRDGKDVTSFNTEDDPTKFAVVNNDLIIRRTVDEDVDTYSCEATVGSETVKKDVPTVSKPHLKIIAAAVVIEGQKLRLECLAFGTPKPTISWRFENDTYTETEGRVKLTKNSQGLENAIFEIESSELSDRGDYFCVAANDATTAQNSSVEIKTYVRVKDKLAAVWPFIGICAEVIILCSIIFAYERNRSKMDLDESDTDAGADQKTADTGKDSVRQRK
uniref:Basigin n=1 Tax=Lygus hesperus TaxID=30085 RepID=A0A0A9WMP9_LYGHE